MQKYNCWADTETNGVHLEYRQDYYPCFDILRFGKQGRLGNSWDFRKCINQKRRYWPKYIHREEIMGHFMEKEAGSIDARPGTFNGIPFHVLSMNE